VKEKSRVRNLSTASFAAGVITFTAGLFCALVPAGAQTPPAQSNPAARAASSGIPRLPNGKPDFNGVWQRPYVPDMSKDGGAAQKGPGAIPYTAEYAQIFKDYDPRKFDYTGHCLPQGLTRSVNSPFPVRIVQTNDIFAILYEAWNVFEIVHIDGRLHQKDPDPLWFGNPVGKWDGDTLVVDTIGFNDLTNLDTVGHPHSDAMHTVERFVRTDDKHIGYEITLEDSKAFTKPWKNTRVFTLRPDWEVMEYSCEENNKDFTEGHIK
jgi:hypothetical protein